MSLPKFGVEATVENSAGYIKAMKAIENANSSASDNVKSAVTAFDGFGGAISAAGVATVAAGTIIANAVSAAFNLVGHIIGSVISTIGNFAKSMYDAGVTFSKTMANISSITNVTGKDLRSLSQELINIGADSAAGPQAVADAYYDVASGVQDVNNRLPILNAAIAASEAGQANLTATTNGLVSVMNGFSYSADKATFVSDIFTRTVGLGVGTMDDFVSAMSPLSGILAANNLTFQEFGAEMAFMTAKGIPASQAATAIKAAVTSLSRATPGATKAIKAMGEKSIEASLKQNGLAYTLGLLQQGAKKTHQNFQTMLGSVEAMQAAAALGTDEFTKFFDTFVDGVDGATAAARELQRADVSFQLKLAENRMNALGLSVSQAVLPAFNKFLTVVNKAFAKIDWKKIGSGFEVLGDKLGVVAGDLATKFSNFLSGVDWGKVSGQIAQTIADIGTWIASIDWNAVIAGVQNFVTNVIAAGQQVATWFSQAQTTASNFVATWNTYWPQVSAAVSNAFNQVVTFIQGAWTNITTSVQSIIDSVSATWNSVWGAAGSIATVVSTTWTSVTTFITDALAPVQAALQPMIDSLGSLWNSLFGADGLIPTLVPVAWQSVQDAINNALEPVRTAIDGVVQEATAVWNVMFGDGGSLVTTIANAWVAVQAAVDGAKAGIKAGFDAISMAITVALAPAKAFIDGLVNAIDNIKKAVSLIGGGGGGGGAPGGAGGGDLVEGMNVVGEHGKEVIWKSGNQATVFSAAQSRQVLSGVSHITPLGGSNTAKLEKNSSSVSSGISQALNSVMQQVIVAPIPVAVGGGGDTYNNANTRNTTINFNGVPNSDNAMQKFALLNATGRF